MSLLAPLQTGCLVGFALLLVLAAWQDLRTMRIADAVSLAIVPVFAVWALSGLALGTLSFSVIGLALACAAAVFGVGAAAFAIGAAGRRRREAAGCFQPVRRPRPAAGFPAWSRRWPAACWGWPSWRALRSVRSCRPGNASIRLRLRRGLPYGPAIAAGGLWVAGSLALQ